MLTTPLLISLLVFLAVACVVGVLGFVLRDPGPKASSRLDTLVGKRRHGGESQADILRKTAFEGDRKSLLEMLTPRVLSLRKFLEQADCHIKPATLAGIGVGLALLGMLGSFLAHVPWLFLPLVGAVLFCIPLVWVWNKRRARLKKFAAQLPDALELVARALRAGHS